MRKAILLFICCLPAFGNSIISTQLQGWYFGNSVVACSGTTSCQWSYYRQFRDPNFPSALYTQQGSINATAGYWFSNSAISIPLEEIVQPISVPAGSYLLSADLNTFDGSQIPSGNGTGYLAPIVRVNATFNIPVDSGDVQMKLFVWSFSTEDYGSGNLTVTATMGGSRVSYNYFAPDCTRNAYAGPCAAGPAWSPEFDLTIPHTWGTVESINFQAYSGTTFQESNSNAFEAIITPTPEPAAIGLASLALGVLLLAKRKRCQVS